MLNFFLRICFKCYRVVVEATLLAMTITACNASFPPPPSAATPSTVQSSTATPSIASTQSPPSFPSSSSSPDSPSPTSSPVSPAQSDGGNEALQQEQQEAVQVIRDYYRAIARRDYEQAYSAWQDGGAASKQSFDQFKQGFANTASVAVEVGEPGQIEGAAGSLYIEIPVTVTAVTTSGTPQRFRGTYQLRRVNDVPGSTSEQRRWHLYSADINQVN